ncbi:MAG: hypothetical protein ACMXYK_05440 [Candidatus Woesearchaeota archaeon]
MTQAIKLTLSDTLAHITKKNAEKYGYYNVQELIQEAIRQKNFELDKKEAIRSLKNIDKRNISPLTKAERLVIAQKLESEDSSDILRKYNFNKIA